MSKIVDIRLIKYLIAGGSAFLTEYASFYVLYAALGLGLYLANSISFCMGLIVSFTLNRTWAFKQDNFKRQKHHQMLMYGALALFNLMLTNVIIGALKTAGLNPRFGKLATMCMIVVWNYFIFKFIVFASSDKD